MASLRGVLAACALAALALAGCVRFSESGPPTLGARLIGASAATGKASATRAGDTMVDVQVELPDGSAADWDVTVRSGDCSAPGPVLHPIGVVHQGELRVRIDASLDSLCGTIVAIAAGGSDVVSSCGALE